MKRFSALVLPEHMVKIFIGLLVGLISGGLFVWWWRWRMNAVYKGPSSSKTQKQILKDSSTGLCFRFVPQTHVCPPSINVLDMDHSDDDSSS